MIVRTMEPRCLRVRERLLLCRAHFAVLCVENAYRREFFRGLRLCLCQLKEAEANHTDTHSDVTPVF